jgi:hypothetical protein
MAWRSSKNVEALVSVICNITYVYPSLAQMALGELSGSYLVIQEVWNVLCSGL